MLRSNCAAAGLLSSAAALAQRPSLCIKPMPGLKELDRKQLLPVRVYWSPSSENGANFGRLTSTDPLPPVTAVKLRVTQFVDRQKPFNYAYENQFCSDGLKLSISPDYFYLLAYLT